MKIARGVCCLTFPYRSNLTTNIEVGGGIGCAEMVGTTNYIALVGGGKQPKFPQNKVQGCPEDSGWVQINANICEVQVWNDATQSVAFAIEFKTPVQRVRVSKEFLVVVLLNSVGIYKMKAPPVKIADYETANNPFGLCAMENNIVAFPGKNVGQVKLFDGNKNVTIIPAHTTPLRALALSRKGDMVATASEKGTIIRVWAYPSTTKLAEFRRGIDEAAIFSLAFSPNGLMLAVSSDKSTIHIFDIAAGVNATAEPDPKAHKYGFLSKVPLLPRQFSDTYSSASTRFEMGDEPINWGPQSKSLTLNAGIPGVPGGRPTKGLLGWLNDQTLLVVGAGQDARWEKFIVGIDSAGGQVVYREGWQRYLE